MEISLFLLSCALFLEAVLGAHSGAINADRLRWQDARQACLDTRPSCDLSVQGTELRAFWDLLRLSTGNYYWIGARKRDLLQWNHGGTTLIESQGCYEAPAALNSTVGAVKGNGPKSCLSQCDGNYAALKNSICYCVNSEEMTSYIQRPLEECHVYCDTEPYRCGGDRNRVSVYKIPDRTLLHVVGSRKSFFWRRTFTNENEWIVMTNKPRAKQGRFCVSEPGQYSTADQRSECPSGSQPLTFENVKVMEFLDATSSVTDTDMDYQLPLTFSRQFLWLDGGEVTPAPVAGKGGCLAITHNGQHLSLAIKKCKDKLPSVCSCYTQTDTTEAPTTQSASTTTEMPSTQITSTTESSFVSSTTQEETTSRSAFSTSISDSSSSPTTELNREFPSDENSTLLFPFHVMNESDVPLSLEPAAPGRSLSNGDEDTASAALSMEMIVGISVGAVAIVIIVVVVAIVVKRRRTTSSSSLLKNKGSKRGTNYPI